MGPKFASFMCMFEVNWKWFPNTVGFFKRSMIERPGGSSELRIINLNKISSRLMGLFTTDLNSYASYNGVWREANIDRKTYTKAG